MFELKPRYIDLYNAPRIALYSLVLSSVLIILLNIGLRIIFDSRSARAATINEIIDFIVIILLSAFSYFLAAFLVLKMKDTFADSCGPFLPVMVFGFLFFVTIFTSYSFVIGLGNEKVSWFTW